MIFEETRQPVKNRGVPPDSFLRELVEWARTAHDGLFQQNANADVYLSVRPVLGPFEGLLHRKATMLEVLRVLGGFESSWNWNEGVDVTNKTSVTPETIEAGLWQVSMNALAFGEDLKELTKGKIGSAAYSQGRKFQKAMKADHPFAIEFIVRLLRHTTKHNGPVKRHEIDPWLRVEAVDEFQRLLAA